MTRGAVVALAGVVLLCAAGGGLARPDAFRVEQHGDAAPSSSSSSSAFQGPRPSITEQGRVPLAPPSTSNSDFQSTQPPVRTFVRDFGTNITFTCPEIRSQQELFKIRQLDWFCVGCGLLVPLGSTAAGERRRRHLATFDRSSGALRVLVNPTRMGLDRDDLFLALGPIRASDAGEYFCLVDGQQQPSLISRLEVQVTAPTANRGVPDPPGKPLVMGFTSRSVNLSWTPPLSSHNSPISHYLIHIRVGEDTMWDDTREGAIIETPDNATVFQVVDLQPFTTYSFRVTAVNAMGRSKYSKDSYYMLTLREVPSGKPIITAAHNTSSTSIQLTWRSPDPKTLHGEFLGYRVAYKPRNVAGSESVKETLIKDPAVTKHTIQKLDIFTQYLVSLQVYNPEGLGPSTTVVVMTDEGVPSMPVNVSMREVTNSSVRVMWHSPTHENGIIQGYRLYYMHQNFTDVRTVKDAKGSMEYLLEGLTPYTKYRIWLKAFTWKNEGHSSPPFEMRTDVSGPSAPVVTNLTCRDERSIFLQWERPARVFKTVDLYRVFYRMGGGRWQSREVEANVGNDTYYSSGARILLEGLVPNSEHEIKLQAATRSIYDADRIYLGDFSEPHKLLLRLNCDQARAFSIARPAAGDGGAGDGDAAVELGTGVLAGVAFICVAFLVVLLILAVWRKYFNESYYYLDESAPSAAAAAAATMAPEWELESVGPDGKPTAVPAHMYIQRVAAMHADGDVGFSKEFQSVHEDLREEEEGKANGGSSLVAAEASRKAKNRGKNRYPNVVAFDHTRVQLRPLPGQKRGEYVNANYIDGFQKSRAYIATQGPLPSTFDSFWRMVWEQKVRVVVMITNLVELGKKCDQYWPEAGTTSKYGLIEVTHARQDVMAFYTLRTFRIRHTKIRAPPPNGKKSGGGTLGNGVATQVTERFVLQYQFTAWPDHGVPSSNPLPLLGFVRRASEANRDCDAPIVVHCSAGVGRTGAFMLVDAMLKQMKSRGELNLLAYLRHIRTQRNHLVQTEEQYVFVHDTLAEAVAAGETNIHRSYLSRYINSLQSSFTTDENSIPWQLLDRQFKLATAYRPQEIEFAAALKPSNQAKNQNFDFLPIESARVAISPKPGMDGSDYINASWLAGFNSQREFILTQHPMEQTVLDFWQLVWDHNVKTVVVLSPIQQPAFGIFWPVQNLDVKLDEATVHLISEGESGGFQTKDFTLRSSVSGDTTQWQTKLVFCPSWPLSAVNNGNCGNLTAVTELIQVVQSLRGQVQQQQRSPLLVVDRFGGTEAATFCALHTLLSQLEFENHVDIYEYARVSHLQRPGIWRSQDAYFFLYRVMDAVCNGNVAAAANSGSSSNGSCSSYADSCVNFQTFHPVTFYHAGANAVATPTDGAAVTATTTLVRGVPLSVSASSDASSGGGSSVATAVIRIPPDGRETLLRAAAQGEPANTYHRY